METDSTEPLNVTSDTGNASNANDANGNSGNNRAGETSAQVDARLAAHGDDIDMNVPGRILERREVYRGAIFRVEDTLVGLTTTSGGMVTIRRQVLRHAPCVVMLVHDTATDRYLIEREYRIGNDSFAYGLPAGLMDDGEDVREAALRELQETGVAPISPERMRIEHVTDCYSSEGMTDELAHIMVIHLDGYRQKERHFDADEHVESAWVSWADLQATHVTASNSIIAIQHEQIRRLTAGE